MASDLENRVIALEMRLAHHERLAEEVSDVLAEQANVIDLLTRQVRALRERLREVEAGPMTSPQDERPPPHY